jgi:hypothetical protein
MKLVTQGVLLAAVLGSLIGCGQQQQQPNYAATGYQYQQQPYPTAGYNPMQYQQQGYPGSYQGYPYQQQYGYPQYGGYQQQPYYRGY